ncbi:MAG: uroporphyrinogen-III C-methyltransferase [Chitinivibrionales bacterium]|nr:uroporphyrinogen-III C-methyltransferase [Chitinivibrionales bacterium]
MTQAKVYLVGAGPGDPELITRKAVSCLNLAEVVVYDFLASPLLLRHAPESAEKIYVGKKCGNHSTQQQIINQILVQKARNGNVVIRLKGGDPFVFGRGSEEIEALLEADIPFEIVPGITAGIAVCAYAGIPVTDRRYASSVAYVTGHERVDKHKSSINWRRLATGVDTLVFYMGVTNLPFIAQQLIEHGRDAKTPAAVIRWGTTPEQQTVTGALNEIAAKTEAAHLKPPAIIVIGEVVRLRKHYRWFDTKPLCGKRIINTRAVHQSSKLTLALQDSGAHVMELPAIAIERSAPGIFAEQFNMLDTFDWIIFTSPNAVEIFFDELIKQKRDIRALGTARIACIGQGTADAVRRMHLHAGVVGSVATAEGLLDSLRNAASWSMQKILLPRAAKARTILPDTLRTWGADVTVIPAYTTVTPHNIPAEVFEKLTAHAYDAMTFTSSSTVINTINLLKSRGKDSAIRTIKAASIGPITSATLREHGITPIVEAREHSIPGLVDAIREHFA